MSPEAARTLPQQQWQEGQQQGTQQSQQSQQEWQRAQTQRQQLINQQPFLTSNPAQLPTGSYIGRNDGRLYRVVQGRGIIAVESHQNEEFLQVSQDPYESSENLRLMTAQQANIRAQF